MTEKELHILINRYFDGETSIADERALRRELARTPLHTPLIEEAKAVIGYSLVCAAPAAADRHISGRALRGTWWNVAATLVISVLTVAALLTYSHRHEPDECVAYLNGKEISERNTVMSMMMQNLSEMGQASDRLKTGIADDVGEISDILNSTDM